MNIPIPKKKIDARFESVNKSAQCTVQLIKLHFMKFSPFTFPLLCPWLLSHEQIQDVCVRLGEGGDSASVRTHPVYTPCLQSQYNCVCVCPTDFPL